MQERVAAHSQSSLHPPSPSEHPPRLATTSSHLQHPGAPLHLLGSLSRTPDLTITRPSPATSSRVVRLARRQVPLGSNLQELQEESWRQDQAQARWPGLGWLSVTWEEKELEERWGSGRKTSPPTTMWRRRRRRRRRGKVVEVHPVIVKLKVSSLSH